MFEQGQVLHYVRVAEPLRFEIRSCWYYEDGVNESECVVMFVDNSYIVVPTAQLFETRKQAIDYIINDYDMQIAETESRLLNLKHAKSFWEI